jgi:divalent metal cation (Fe/Co/Zn/Cd) transporter
MNRLQRSLRATFTGLAVNAVLSGVKFAAGIAGHSHEIAHDVKDKIRGQIPAVRDVLVHIEPARKAEVK